jgi:hypothetical protein
MKKVSTITAEATRNFHEEQLTIGLDLGDRSSWYCVLNEAGQVLLEQRLSTTAKALREVFGRTLARLARIDLQLLCPVKHRSAKAQAASRRRPRASGQASINRPPARANQ